MRLIPMYLQTQKVLTRFDWWILLGLLGSIAAGIWISYLTELVRLVRAWYGT